MADSRGVTTVFGEAVVGLVAVGIAAALGLGLTGSPAGDIDPGCCRPTGIGIGLPIASTDRVELAGADHRSRLADSRGVTTVFGEAVIGLIAVGIAGAWRLPAGTEVFHAGISLGRRAGVAVGLAVAPTHRIKDLGAHAPGAGGKAGLKCGADLFAVRLTGGHRDSRAVLETSGICWPVDPEIGPRETGGTRFRGRVRCHPGQEPVFRVGIACLGRWERDQGGAGEPQVIGELEETVRRQIVIPKFKGVDHVAL